MRYDAVRWLPALVFTTLIIAPAHAETPDFDGAFWQHWGDGHAELAGYDLTFPRYRELRKGIAVTIFVTETFSNELRVKSDPGQHAASDEFSVMKLNLIQDFPTGIYDYNMMTSTFVALQPVNGRPAGIPTKVSFSSQEWCGHAYQQLLFDTREIRFQANSYFDGEADRQDKLDFPPGGLSEDALLLWARGFAAPALKAGQTRTVPILRSVQVARLRHVPLVWQEATLSRSQTSQRVSVPAGEFDVQVMTVKIADERTWTFFVEAAPPNRLIKWQTSDGQEADLLGSDRLKYWKMNANGFESGLAKFGLKPRETRAP